MGSIAWNRLLPAVIILVVGCLCLLLMSNRPTMLTIAVGLPIILAAYLGTLPVLLALYDWFQGLFPDDTSQDSTESSGQRPSTGRRRSSKRR